jgi:hypothetical protein
MTDRLRLPDPVDPAAPPRRLAEAAAAVFVGGVLMALLGIPTINPDGEPTLAQQVFFGAWLGSLPICGALLLAYYRAGRKRLKRFERRAGFLPRPRRMELPATGRTNLFRVEYGQRAGRICLMLARWDHHPRDGWRRSEVVHHAWHSADDPVALGADRARFTALAEQLEEEADDDRLKYVRARGLAAERLAERAAARKRATWLVEQLAADSP